MSVETRSFEVIHIKSDSTFGEVYKTASLSDALENLYSNDDVYNPNSTFMVRGKRSKYNITKLLYSTVDLGAKPELYIRKGKSYSAPWFLGEEIFYEKEIVVKKPLNLIAKNFQSPDDASLMTVPEKGKIKIIGYSNSKFLITIPCEERKSIPIKWVWRWSSDSYFTKKRKLIEVNKEDNPLLFLKPHKDNK